MLCCSSVVGQPGICFGLLHLFRGDGVHVSPGKYNIYLVNMVRGITAVLFEYVCEQGESRWADTHPPLWQLEQCVKISKCKNCIYYC